MYIVIYHNPHCGTSRNVLSLIRQSGTVPQVIEYLKAPPSRDELVELLRAMNLPPRALLRQKDTLYDTLGLNSPALSDAELLDAMVRHPILINRPIVVTPKGVRLCRPSESVFDLLPTPVPAFTKEDGSVVGARKPGA